MIFAMGVVQKVGRLAEYWSRHFYTLTPSFWQTMPCSRFMLILRYLHFVDNEDATTDRGLRTWKVQKVLDYVCKRFRESYTSRRELSVDETMIKFKGRLNIEQYIKIKPVKWGVKLFTIAESATGYVLGLLPYTGKRPDTAFGKTTQTVLDVSDNFLRLGHRIYVDNYYMSLELVKALYDRDTLCCGIVNANRVGLPPDVKKTCLAVKHLKRGDSLKRMRDGTRAVTWMDTRVVNLLTNVPGCLGDADVRRRDKKTSAEMIISRPTAIENYNKHMGGVDLSDQRVGTYRRHMKSLTWYLQLFFHILELSAVQAYLLHKELHDDGMTQRVLFLGLIDEFIGDRSYTGKLGRPSMERPPAEVRFNRQLDHAPVKLATQSKCAVHLRQVDTLYACSVCNVRMCP